jgi:tetratricopeptide (TPR) repeat protein
MPALLGYAQWKEQNGKSNEALQLYLKAADKYPKEASVHNNLGLYYARNHRLDEAAASMRRAIQIEPKNTRYRNNIATILVDQGQWREAYSHLSEVYSAAVAHYNLGYLLNKKGQTQAALQNFSLAVQADPSMEAARRWVEHLQRTTTQARLPNHPMANGVRITTESIATAPKDPSRPMSNPEPPGTAIASKTNAPPTASTRHPVATTPIPSTEDTAPMPPDGVPPRRLPPTTVQDQPDAQGPSLPGISYQRSSRPMAPLPPITEALRPLPRVN